MSKHKHKIKKLQNKVRQLQLENADLIVELVRARSPSPEHQSAMAIITKAAALIEREHE